MTPKHWLELHLHCTAVTAAPLEQALLDCGALSVTLTGRTDRPILEPGVGETPLWPEILVTGLFAADTNTDVVLIKLSAFMGQLPPWRWQILEDQPWERAWINNFQPQRISDRLWICPSWCEPPNPAAVNLMLDPGLAFGTGSHETTFMCLQWLDGLEWQNKTLIDYGCGSGILGIAAVLLGAQHVLAIDNDPQALLATRANALRNGIADNHLTTAAPNEHDVLTADYLVANIVAGPLLELAGTLTAAVKPGGQLCLSGIVDTQVTTIEEAYSPPFQFDPPKTRGDWLCLGAVKCDASAATS